MFRKKDIICGERHDSQLEGYQEKIESKDIVLFSYQGGNFNLYAEKLDNGTIMISCNGGGQYNRRDGSLFHIKYETKNDRILKKLQDVIDKNQETKGNGHCTKVDGLPEGLGDCLEVTYKSGERIYKSSNQNKTVSKESADSFYKIFHELVKKDGYDFTTEGSNIPLFDDADTEYVQGTWKGKHFGDEIEATFEGTKVTIKIEGKVVDDKVEYVIKEGYIKCNQLKEKKEESHSHYDYESFHGIESFAKKNEFTMNAYFYGNGSSSCELFNFDKSNNNKK